MSVIIAATPSAYTNKTYYYLEGGTGAGQRKATGSLRTTNQKTKLKTTTTKKR